MTQISGPNGGGGGPHVSPSILLNYSLGTDLDGISIPATTWTDLITDQTFTVVDSSSLVEVLVSGAGVMTSGSATGLQFVIDALGTPIFERVGNAAGNTQNIFGGSGPIYFEGLTGLSAGPHTIKVQIYCNDAGFRSSIRSAQHSDCGISSQWGGWSCWSRWTHHS